MANTKISDIANSVCGGENSEEAGVCGVDGAKAGMGVYQYNLTGFKPIEGSAALVTGMWGVIKEHYHTGIDTTLSNGQSYQIVKRGIVNIFIDDPGKDIGAGTEIWLSGATTGSFGLLTDRDFIALSGASAVGRLLKRVSNGDTVARAELY